MALGSNLFRNNERLQACAVSDPAHLTPGTKGHHVRLVQTALVNLQFGGIDGKEYIDGVYGPTTTSAVLRYKTKRRIINFAYQTQPDNIVGKMTIASLDREMTILESQFTPPR